MDPHRGGRLRGLPVGQAAGQHGGKGNAWVGDLGEVRGGGQWGGAIEHRQGFDQAARVLRQPGQGLADESLKRGRQGSGWVRSAISLTGIWLNTDRRCKG